MFDPFADQIVLKHIDIRIVAYARVSQHFGGGGTKAAQWILWAAFHEKNYMIRRNGGRNFVANVSRCCLHSGDHTADQVVLLYRYRLVR